MPVPENSPHAFEQGIAAVIVINSDGTAVTKLMILSQAWEAVRVPAASLILLKSVSSKTTSIMGIQKVAFEMKFTDRRGEQTVGEKVFIHMSTLALR